MGSNSNIFEGWMLYLNSVKQVIVLNAVMQMGHCLDTR